MYYTAHRRDMTTPRNTPDRLTATERNAATIAATTAHAATPAVYADPASGNHFDDYATYLAFRADHAWFAALYPLVMPTGATS